MQTILPYIQAVLSVLLVIGILLQRSEAGLGAAFGGDSLGSTKYQRRGFEKLLFNFTALVAILFAAASFATLFYRA